MLTYKIFYKLSEKYIIDKIYIIYEKNLQTYKRNEKSGEENDSNKKKNYEKMRIKQIQVPKYHFLLRFGQLWSQFLWHISSPTLLLLLLLL